MLLNLHTFRCAGTDNHTLLDIRKLTVTHFLVELLFFLSLNSNLLFKSGEMRFSGVQATVGVETVLKVKYMLKWSASAIIYGLKDLFVPG